MRFDVTRYSRWLSTSCKRFNRYVTQTCLSGPRQARCVTFQAAWAACAARREGNEAVIADAVSRRSGRDNIHRAAARRCVRQDNLYRSGRLSQRRATSGCGTLMSAERWHKDSETTTIRAA